MSATTLQHQQDVTTWRPPHAPLDFGEMATTEPPPRDEVLPGLIAGSVGGIIATGGSRKSYFSLQTATAVAGGLDTLGIAPRGTGRVVLLSLEDPKQIVHERSRSLAKAWPADVVAQVRENLDIWQLVGAGANILDPAFHSWLRSKIEGVRLLIIDTKRRIHRLDENDNGDMSMLIAILEQLCADFGVTIIFLHHTGKGGETGEAHASRGASALTDNARWILRLDNMKQEEAKNWSDRSIDGRAIDEHRAGVFVQMTHAKCNYGIARKDAFSPGAPKMPDQWFQAGEGGILAPVQLLKAKSTKTKQQPSGRAATGPENEDDDWK